MKIASARVTLAIVALGLAFAVSGCGGGGSGDGTASMTGPGEPPAPAPRADLESGPGLHLSNAAPVLADATDKTVLAAQEDGDTVPTQSAVITRDTAESTTAVSTSGSSVKSIRGDGDGGFHVTFVDGENDDREIPIHFERDDLAQGATSYRKDVDGTTFWLWSPGVGFSDGNRIARQSGYDYLALLGGQARNGQTGFERFRFIFGARTPAEAQTMGQASYNGTFYADSWAAGSSSSAQRHRLDGHLRLVANFHLGKLEGYVRNVRGSDFSHWPTSSFSITDGRFNEQGQFTATLTGHDSADDPDLAQSAAGYVGELLGELYGPRADEIGAVLTATRDVADDAHDRVLEGRVIGKRVIGAHTDDAPFSTGVDRHDTNTSSPRVVSQGETNRVTAVTSDGNGGYRIAYLVDGQENTLSLGAGDGLADAPVPGGRVENYHKRSGSDGYYLRQFESEYSSVARWSRNRYDGSGSDAAWVFGTWGHVVHGSRTPSASMPTTGSATYAGAAGAHEWEPSPAHASSRFAPYHEGSLSLRADFAAGTIAGEIDNLLADRLAISNGRIQGNGLSGDLSGSGYSGTVRGAFYGPAAEEAAGVMEATDAENKMLHGWFRGSKQ